MIHLRFALGAAGLALSACHSQSIDPAPPAASYELTVAPPGARGARAAGTDAAPAAPGEGDLGEPGTEGADEPEEDGGTDAGAAQPDAAPGVAL